MPSRFDEAPDESLLLTPELAERVVEKYAERQAERERAAAAERERLASLTRVQELADLLGTTPEEINEIAREEAGSVRPSALKPSPESMRSTVNETPRGVIHAAYLSILGVVLILAVAVGSARPTTPPSYAPILTRPSSISASPGYLFDPYSQGMTRDISFLGRAENVEEVLVDPRIVAPPAGLRATLVTPNGKKTIGGPPGLVKATLANAEAFRRSIRSLLAYEESLATVEGDVPTVNYDQAPWIQQAANFQGQPTLIGWHVVEVSNGKGAYRALLPDRRYAKNMDAYERAMKYRLEHLTDTKFFAELPPANLRPDSIQIPAPWMPKGGSMMAWNGKKTVWAQGIGDQTFSPEKVRQGLSEFMADAARRLAETMGDADHDHLQITLVYPGGEYYDNWPLDDAPSYPAGGPRDRQATELNSMVDALKTALDPPSAPKNKIHYGSTTPSKR